MLKSLEGHIHMKKYSHRLVEQVCVCYTQRNLTLTVTGISGAVKRKTRQTAAAMSVIVSTQGHSARTQFIHCMYTLLYVPDNVESAFRTSKTSHPRFIRWSHLRLWVWEKVNKTVKITFKANDAWWIHNIPHDAVRCKDEVLWALLGLITWEEGCKSLGVSWKQGFPNDDLAAGCNLSPS